MAIRRTWAVLLAAAIFGMNGHAQVPAHQGLTFNGDGALRNNQIHRPKGFEPGRWAPFELPTRLPSKIGSSQSASASAVSLCPGSKLDTNFLVIDAASVGRFHP